VNSTDVRLDRTSGWALSDKVFAGLHFVARDDRFEYGEERFIALRRGICQLKIPR
jgi:hypothetical protein